jgi:thiol-disulfide isomerase/thioredoxin
VTQATDTISRVGADAAEKDKGVLRNDQNKLIFDEGFSFSGYERDPLYLNLGTRKFMDISGVSGIDSITDGRGAVFADFDNDGDLDVFLTTLQGSAHLLFRNNVGQASHFLRVSLQGSASGRDACGSVVRIRTSTGTLTKIKSAGSGFLAQHDPRPLFGLGEDAKVESIEVTWPSGKLERFEGAPAGTSVILREGKGSEGLSRVTEHRTQLPDPLTRLDTVFRDLRVRPGDTLPEIPVRTIAGSPGRLSEHLHSGRRTLINLWATWCLPCAREMPELQLLVAGLAARNINVIGLNLDTEPDADVRGYLERHQISYTNLTGGTSAIEKIYASDRLFVPLSILVDDRGTVLEIMSGWSMETHRKFISLSGGQ